MSEPKAQDTISNLLEERDRLPYQEDVSLSLNATKKQASPPSSSHPRDKKVENDAVKGDDQDIVNPELKSLQAELEKTQKTIAENQKYGRQNAQRLKTALKITQGLIEDGTLSEGEAQNLMVSLAHNPNSDDELETSPYTAHPFAKVLKIANSELDNLRKYSDDELLDNKVKAFDYFLILAPPEEIKDALDELNDLSAEPIALTKKMLAIGKRYYDASYKDIIASGGVQGYLTKQQQELAKLQQNIDKLTKKLAQYEDFDPPSYRLHETGDAMESEGRAPKKDSITALFEERDKVPRRR